MAISYNTGVSNDSGGGTAANVTLTIPAGVLSGDVVLFTACGFAGASGATLSASSTGTAPVLLDQGQTSISSFNNGGLWYFIASGTDAGKVITITLSGGTNPFWSASLAAYTGASALAPIDVHGIFTATGTGISANCPARTTGVSGDWAVYLGAIGTSASTLNEPSGTTSRQKHVASSGIASDICDSAASVGGAGTGIGGASVTYSSGSGGVSYNVFTVGLAPPSGAAPPLPAQQQATVLLLQGMPQSPQFFQAPSPPPPVPAPQHAVSLLRIGVQQASPSGPAFTVGTLTAATAPGGTSGGVLTATTQRTGGPS